ncbi:Rab2a [Hexamita inflata]|uniref:Rab2a n=1 Tax=Hexamita inflata TaxID=28002 RepID=A0ABP1M491_9EUKA
MECCIRIPFPSTITKRKYSQVHAQNLITAKQLNFALVGPNSTGKSTIFKRVVFNEQTDGPTIGVQIGSRSFNVDGQIFNLQIWDFGGIDYKIGSEYLKKADCCMITYHKNSGHDLLIRIISNIRALNVNMFFIALCVTKGSQIETDLNLGIPIININIEELDTYDLTFHNAITKCVSNKTLDLLQ